MTCHQSCCMPEYEMPDIAFEKYGEHVARKVHTCYACHHEIEPGTRYTRYTALIDGELTDEKRHMPGECNPYPPTAPADVEIESQP